MDLLKLVTSHSYLLTCTVAVHFTHLKGRPLVCIFAQEVTISKKKSNFVCFYQITNLVNKDMEVKIPTPKHW